MQVKLQSPMKVFFILSALILASVAISPVASVFGGQKGNEAKGRFYFKQTCKTCHTKDAKGGEITPLSKTQAQWLAYFAKGKHAKGSETLTKYMTEDQLHDALEFLHAHAVDSPQPETCGK